MKKRNHKITTIQFLCRKATKRIGQIWKRGKSERTRKINNMKRNEGIGWKVFLFVKYWPMKKAEKSKTLNHFAIFGIKNKRA